jgi:3-oxoacid CoA-transferase
VYDSPEAALKASGIKDGVTLLAGGFGLSGIPMSTIEAIDKMGIKDLTVVSNNCGTDKWGLGTLLNKKRISKVIASYVGENAEFERQYLSGEIELILTPQGTLAEKLRAGGAGIPAFFTPTGAGTLVSEGGFICQYNADKTAKKVTAKKEVRAYNGKDYVLEDSITGEVAIVKAHKADKFGNLWWRGTSRNFNPDVATAGKFTIAEVDEIVETGSFEPSEVHLPGIYVQAVVKTSAPLMIERRTVMPKGGDGNSSPKALSPADVVRERIAQRCALELKAGMNVNLGIGIPTLIPKLLPQGMVVQFQSENGLLGMGPYPEDGKEHADLINAGKETVTMVPGASLFSSSQSFAMIRGKHVDLTVLGAMEVAPNGDLANWIIPGKLVKGMGGAMDLVSSGTRVIVCMEHCAKKDAHKILQACKLPLTGKQVVDCIITELAVFNVHKQAGQLELIEILDGVSVEELKRKTGCDFIVSKNLKPYRQ